MGQSVCSNRRLRNVRVKRQKTKVFEANRLKDITDKLAKELSDQSGAEALNIPPEIQALSMQIDKNKPTPVDDSDDDDVSMDKPKKNKVAIKKKSIKKKKLNSRQKSRIQVKVFAHDNKFIISSLERKEKEKREREKRAKEEIN
ncbi:hypothetical protein DFA_02529 [Cavenderia fasciculata]|uniref:Uncharacterized protein n=1 Tax=Cavenderia fasciculata TaxID=261658 RepID=F4PZM6_CACFS|nr:uncharacterized protein DFA_02529 [Cavenderia fasciculata]EGG18790.1 hypothetical protein DFA_02529 [Cavenderia fasciculata]|eukprot:XP_004357252.1 hypothetical protein DFA_02529 [Cavenderia fasciculata]